MNNEYPRTPEFLDVYLIQSLTPPERVFEDECGLD
jgi:hypothetical protein